MEAIRRERVIDETQRLRVVRWWYAAHLVAIVAVVVGLLIANGPPSDVELAVVIGLWLGTFATSSILLLTGGLLGLYESGFTVLTVKAVAAVTALATGLFIYGVGVITTPILLLVGIALRLGVIGVQRHRGMRRATAAEISSDVGDLGVEGR